MSKAVLISIQPKWCGLIASSRKTVELRKTKPKLECPFKCYIYCTQGTGKNTFNVPVSPEKIRKHYEETGSMVCLNSPIGNGKVIGEFVCDNIRCFDVPYPAFQKEMDKNILEQSCLTYYQLHRYAYHDALYGWHISDLVIYDTPKELGEFMKPCENDLYCEECAMYREFTEQCGNKALILSRPPQSWCYVEELTEGGADNG